MVAYYGPGDTVTSFYAMVGERCELLRNVTLCATTEFHGVTEFNGAKAVL